MTNVRKPTEARREEVLRAALNILDKEGIHALTLRKLAEGIGISEAALFRHFRSKEDIVNSLAEWIFKDYVALEPEAGKDAIKALSGLMDLQFAIFQRFPQSTCVLFQEEVFREFPEAKRMFDERRRERAKRLAELLRKGKTAKQVARDVDEEAFSLIYMGAMRMAVMEWRSAGFAYDLRPKARPIMEMLGRLLMTSPETKR
jgi:AcrR family transcriptional regulator